jgi:hypothetical protein
MKNKFSGLLPLITIIILSLFFRISGYNWDQGHHLHPDERFLTMVVPALNWPGSLAEYLDTSTSPANPHNTGNGFFVYGTFPLLIVKLIAGFFRMDHYGGILIIGRIFSAICDNLTVLAVMAIAWALTGNKLRTYLSGFLYATLALPIQLSHFLAVDPLLTLIFSLSLLAAARGNIVLTAVFSAMALSVKISAALYLPAPLILLVFSQIKKKFWHRPLQTTGLILLGLISGYLTLRLLYPYAFADGRLLSITLNPKLLANFRELASFNDPSGFFPPAVQWVATRPVIFPFLNLFYFGIGIFHGFLLLLGVILVIFRFKKESALALVTAISLAIFFYQGFQFVKALRYFYPLYPIFSLVMGYAAFQLTGQTGKKLFTIIGIVALALIWPAMVTSIYRHTNTRIAASEWIYRNLPPGSTHTGESWDDGLPLSLDENRRHELYPAIEIRMYGPDTPEKMQGIEKAVNRADSVFLTSNRAFGSLTSLPGQYPETTAFYERLFSGVQGFQLAAQFTSRPNLPLPFVKLCIQPPFLTYGKVSQIVEDCPQNGISVVDDYADETWTVYDHPKVLIFGKNRE